MAEKIILSTPVSHVDWMAGHSERIGHREKGVKYILDRCKQIGWRRIYWRCFEAGRAQYASKLMEEKWVGRNEDNYQRWANPDGESEESYRERVFVPYKGFDSLREAIDYGHKIGLEIHAWLTINEEDHSWGSASRFSRKHPQFRWVKRIGIPYISQLSFAFPEVREYKLSLLKEILAYDIDGVFFDWVRIGDMRNEPHCTPDGTADFGYEKPLLEGFQEKYGLDLCSIPNDDERGVRFRAEPQTIFMREAHKLIKEKDPALPISIMCAHPWFHYGVTFKINGSLHGRLLDVVRWAEEGLMDEVVAQANITPDFRTDDRYEKIYQYQIDEVKGLCDTWLYWWTTHQQGYPGRGTFEESIELAEKLGVKQILYWESNYLDPPNDKTDQVVQAMSKYASGS